MRLFGTHAMTNRTLVSRYRDYLGELIKDDKRSVATGICPLMESDEVAEVRAEAQPLSYSHQGDLSLPTHGARLAGLGSSPVQQ
jgi:hypothetical protein